MPELTLASLTALLGHLLDWISSIREEKVRTDERYQDALRSLLTALQRTRSYLNRLDNGEERDLSTEEELASAWNDAAVQLQPLDEDLTQDLAERALLKGFYWSDPDNWDPSKAEAAKIRIDNVFDRIQSLIVE